MLKIGNNEKKVMKLLCKKDYYTSNGVTRFKKGISYDFEYTTHNCIKIYGVEVLGIKGSWVEWSRGDYDDTDYKGYRDYFYTQDEYRELQLNKVLDEI